MDFGAIKGFLSEHLGIGIEADVQNIKATIFTTAEEANALARSTGVIAESLENLSETSRKNSEHSEKLSEQVKKYTY